MLESDFNLDFSDVSNTDWFASYVEFAVRQGIVKGLADGLFHPEKNITRAETAKIIKLLYY